MTPVELILATRRLWKRSSESKSPFSVQVKHPGSENWRKLRLRRFRRVSSFATNVYRHENHRRPAAQFSRIVLMSALTILSVLLALGIGIRVMLKTIIK